MRTTDHTYKEIFTELMAINPELAMRVDTCVGRRIADAEEAAVIACGGSFDADDNIVRPDHDARITELEIALVCLEAELSVYRNPNDDTDNL